MVTDENGKVIRNQTDVKSGDQLTIRPANGTIKTKVI